ncbi:hypothetical protein CVT24_004487 [Panaeolus cyanescens]|uniref:Arrestin-like N-terminal domain-containing protein n=1 Tax=Panaeolus cyanescens TaxID=181874 RepID=A0A409YBN6_9AGAR|nr:hypothetical protein CVT24_004487 [Panaeolus cyanescens]
MASHMDFLYPNLSSTSDLPAYSLTPCDRLALPSYSFELAYGEQSLGHTPRSRSSRPPPTSTFIRNAGKTTIILNEQEEGVSNPTYGRHGLVHGAVVLEQPHTVIRVVMKIEGKLDILTSERGGETVKMLSESYTLFCNSTSQEACHGQLAFSAMLPTHFKHGDQEFPLPPSYHNHLEGISTLMVRSLYNVHFIITRIRHKKLEMFPKTKHIYVPFQYVPRTRAHRPIIPRPCFFSSVKTSPEEWYQAVTTLKARPNAKIKPVTCHLFIPAGRVYGLTDTIPFHIQLSGSICTLSDLFSASTLDRVTSFDSQNTVVSNKASSTKPLLRVYILRQISIATKGESIWRNIVLREGTINPLPPHLSNCCTSTESCRDGHVDWEGELKPGEADDITCGGFNAANVQAKDFIALALSPPNLKPSPLLELQMTIPIRLVTDSWGDLTLLDTAGI